MLTSLQLRAALCDLWESQICWLETAEDACQVAAARRRRLHARKIAAQSALPHTGANGDRDAARPVVDHAQPTRAGVALVAVKCCSDLLTHLRCLAQNHCRRPNTPGQCPVPEFLRAGTLMSKRKASDLDAFQSAHLK